MKYSIAAAAACAAVLCAVPAGAATFTVVCDVRSTENNELFNNNAYLRLNGYTTATETYRIDDTARTVTLVSRIGTSYDPPENGGGANPVNDGMEFYGDVRSITAEQVVFCPDDKFKCVAGIIDQGALDSTINVGLRVIDLHAGQISYSRNQFTRKKDGSQHIQIASKWTGPCRRQ